MDQKQKIVVHDFFLPCGKSSIITKNSYIILFLDYNLDFLDHPRSAH